LSSDPVGLAPLPPGAGSFPGTAPGGLVSLSVGEGGKRTRRGSLALRLAVPVAIFVAWWILTATKVLEPTVLSGPAATWDAFVQLLLHQDLVGDVAISIRRAVEGLALGAGLGLILGIIVGLYRLGEELLDSSLQMLRTVPYPALIFLFIVWFGVGEPSHVYLIALATLFPMYLNTFNGVRNVDRRVVEAARSFGVEGWQLIRRVVVPLAMPSIMTGLRFSAGISVIALVFTESIGASQGIGYLVSQANSLQQIPVLVVCIIIYAIIGIAADISVRILERYTMPWRRHEAVR
jgi:sulfonate transport system permease protein